MTPPVEKTNAMRLLDAHHVQYAVYTFSPDIHSATGVAAALALAPEEVYKTLVLVRPSGKALLVMIAGPREIDLKRVASAVGEQAAYGADGAAQLVPAGATPETFAAAVSQVLSTPAQQRTLSEHARQRLLTRYDWRLLGAKLHTFYQDILETTKQVISA